MNNDSSTQNFKQRAAKAGQKIGRRPQHVVQVVSPVMEDPKTFDFYTKIV